MASTELILSASPSPLDLAWTAGFFDGEGHVRSVGQGIQVSVGQVDPDPLRRLWQWFGGSVRGRADTDIATWQVSGPTAAGFLWAVYPYLQGEKAGQAEAALLNWRPRSAVWCRACGSLERRATDNRCNPCATRAEKRYNERRKQERRHNAR